MQGILRNFWSHCHFLMERLPEILIGYDEDNIINWIKLVVSGEHSLV